MKKEIEIYITGVINGYTNTIAVLETNGAFSTSLNTLVAIKNEFESLLDVVVDIVGDKEQSIMNFNMALEDRKTKGYNQILEKVCDNFKEKNCKLVQQNENLIKELETYKLSESIWKNIQREHLKKK